MPSSRKALKSDHSKGERLHHQWVNDAAQQINALSGVGDAVDVISIGGGKFTKVKRKPPQVRDAVLTEDMDAAGSGAPQEDKSDFKFKFLYRDKDDADLLIEGNDEQDGVNRNAGLSGSEGDYVAVAWINNEWRALGGGTDTSTSLTDGCECDQTSLVQGVPLSGDPTICCTGHERFTIDLGGLGTFTLYHSEAAGYTGAPDTWSTAHTDEALDNPWVNDCYPEDDDLYDVVMELTSTGATITLEARYALNCDEVCFEYRRNEDFKCQMSNQFNLVKFSGVGELSLPVCVCVIPSYPVEKTACAPVTCMEEDVPKELVIEVTSPACSPGMYRITFCSESTPLCGPSSPENCIDEWGPCLQPSCETRDGKPVLVFAKEHHTTNCVGFDDETSELIIHLDPSVPPSDSGHCAPCGS